MDIFWNSYWPSLAAAMTTSIIVAAFTAFIIKKIIRPNLSIEAVYGHHSPSDDKKTISFYLKNKGALSLESHGAHCFLYIDMSCFIPAEGELVSTKSGAFIKVEAFNDKPCHQGARILITQSTLLMNKPFPYDWVDQCRIYYSVFTSRGPLKPNFFNEEGQETLLDMDDNVLGYRTVKTTQ